MEGSDKSSGENDEPEYPSEEDSDCEKPGHFYVRFKESVPPLVRKDMSVEDLWILLKRPLVTTQSLSECTDMAFVKSLWHGHNKEMKMKVLVLGNPDEVKIKVDQYKFAIKSVNLCGFQSLIDNLIDFKARKNPYVDSILSIKNEKSKFKVLKRCDPVLVEAVR
jgi:hypothetical protein